MKEMLMCTVG